MAVAGPAAVALVAWLSGVPALGQCPPGSFSCGGRCVDFLTDSENCGDCGRRCGQGLCCQRGRCNLTCPVQTPANCFGGCYDLQTSDEHCGQCGNACRLDKTCIGGLCECPVSLQNCEDRCVDLNSNRQNCGSCGRMCAAGQICESGRCIVSCPRATSTNCYGGCYDLQTSFQHCGVCGVSCVPGQNCVKGTCIAPCQPLPLGSSEPIRLTGSSIGTSSHRGSCAGSGPEAVYAWTPPVTGTYVFDTFGSSFDTVLYLRNGSCDGTEIVCGDDVPGSVQSEIVARLDVDQRVIIFVDTFSTAPGGNYVLNIRMIP